MDMTRWDRHAPLAAIGAVILWAIGVFVIESGDSPADGAGAEAVTYFENDQATIYIGSSFVMAGALLLIWFAATLREAIMNRSPGSTRVGSVVFGAGVATAILAMALPTAQIGGAFAADADAPLEPAAAQALWYASDGFFIATMYAAALLTIATAIAILRTRMFPRWLAWVSIVLGIWLLISIIGWIALIFVFPLWLVLVSVLLWRNAPAAGPETAPAASTPLG